MKRRDPSTLRSNRWFGPDDLRSFAHRQRLQQVGYAREEFVGKPVVAIVNTWSDLSPCHAHLRERASAVARGVVAAGGFPVELPALSLGEVMVKPTTMMYRNFLAMETEELLRSHPVDAAVLLGGCDKTGPAMLMGAISADMPCIFVPAGSMMNATWHGEKVGAGTHTRRFFDEYRAGQLSKGEWVELETGMARTIGTCNTMGTASTITLAIEALGLSPAGAAAIPAADADHERMAVRAGSRAVDLAWEQLAPSRLLSRASFLNAVTTVLSCGGSTNAPIHLIAMARRAGVSLSIDDFDDLARKVPVLVDLMPAGKHLMADLHRAGGLPALLRRLGPLIDETCQTISGCSLQEAIADARVLDQEVIRPMEEPVSRLPAFAVVRGNLAPSGALIKPTTFSPELLSHTGPALVFDGPADLKNRVDDPSLPVTRDSVLVLRGAGPVGGPGMPEWGNLPIPKKLLAAGVRDMLRISDARMSGTHYGACVLHVAPESAVGGPLALVRDGDLIKLDFDSRQIDMLVDPAELEQRRSTWRSPARYASRGYAALYVQHVTQAPEGCDFDFLEGSKGVQDAVIY